jgi:PBP1b-binding outer membrane lipoprotein LpoB
MKKSVILILFVMIVLASCTTDNDIKVEEQEQLKYVTTAIVEEKNFSEQVKLP